MMIANPAASPQQLFSIIHSLPQKPGSDHSTEMGTRYAARSDLILKMWNRDPVVFWRHLRVDIRGQMRYGLALILCFFQCLPDLLQVLYQPSAG
ncbi:MAG TPA: hypothetical protein VFA68_16170 [Terriglobales bacterium]|nr:hypothetical protein [Terriglobales bacterium]